MSDYDLAIAIPLANWGCSDQAIADEIINHVLAYIENSREDLELVSCDQETIAGF